jgi:hypothetical protein
VCLNVCADVLGCICLNCTTAECAIASRTLVVASVLEAVVRRVVIRCLMKVAAFNPDRLPALAQPHKS